MQHQAGARSRRSTRRPDSAGRPRVPAAPKARLTNRRTRRDVEEFHTPPISRRAPPGSVARRLAQDFAGTNVDLQLDRAAFHVRCLDQARVPASSRLSSTTLIAPLNPAWSRASIKLGLGQFASAPRRAGATGPARPGRRTPRTKLSAKSAVAAGARPRPPGRAPWNRRFELPRIDAGEGSRPGSPAPAGSLSSQGFAGRSERQGRPPRPSAGHAHRAPARMARGRGRGRQRWCAASAKGMVGLPCRVDRSDGHPSSRSARRGAPSTGDRCRGMVRRCAMVQAADRADSRGRTRFLSRRPTPRAGCQTRARPRYRPGFARSEGPLHACRFAPPCRRPRRSRRARPASRRGCPGRSGRSRHRSTATAFFQRVCALGDGGRADARLRGRPPRSRGTLSSLYFYAYASLQIPVGLMVDAFGPRRVLAVSAAIAAVGSALFRGGRFPGAGLCRPGD